MPWIPAFAGVTGFGVMRLCGALAGLFLLPSLALAELPPGMGTTLQRVCASEDAFIRYAVIKEAKAHYPGAAQDIDAFIAQRCGVPPIVSAVEVETDTTEPVEVAATETTESPWEGEVTAGVDMRSGNSDKTDLSLKSQLVYDGAQWKNTLAGEAYNSEEDNNRVAEEYRVGNRLDYKLGDGYYAFGDLKYVNDRFSGFEYRLSEVVGLGRVWVDDAVWMLDTRAGLGARQSKRTSGEDDNELLLKLGTDARWNITDGLELSESLSADIAAEASIFESETALKSRITDTLSLKTSFNVEHITDVPAGKKKTDTRTNLGVVYEY